MHVHRGIFFFQFILAYLERLGVKIFQMACLACETPIGVGRALLVICLSCIVHCLCWLQKRCAKSHLMWYRYVNCIPKG